MNQSRDAAHKLATLWHKLRELELAINNDLLPLIWYLEIHQDEPALADELEQCARTIDQYFTRRRLVTKVVASPLKP